MLGKKCVLACIGIVVSLWLGIMGCGGSAAVSVGITAPTTTVDGADSVTLTATILNDPNAAGLNWTHSGGGNLSATTGTHVTYTAPAATSSQQTATVTVTSVADSSKTATVTITIPAKPVVTTSPTDPNLASQVGSSYSYTLAVSGGISPYNWTLTAGSLPSCLTLNASTGVISGTVRATCAGTFTPTFTVTDSGSPTKLTASLQVNITIAAATPITFGVAPTSTGTFNVAYSSAVAATGGSGALTYSKASGTLPPDFTLAASGAITGTPKAADIGTWTFAATAADAFGDSAPSSNYSIVVSYPSVSVTTGSTLTSGYGNSAYSNTLAATGGNGGPYTWSVISGGATLTALNLTLSNAGVLSGTPPVAGGSANFTVQAVDSASNSGSAPLTLTIRPGLAISTSSPLPAGYGNTLYSQTLGTTGGSGSGLRWSVTSGASSLTALNLSLSNTGVLSGTPPVAGGSASIGVSVTDSASNTATGTIALTINPGVSITVPTLAAAYPGAAYTSSALTASGGNSGPYNWSMTAASGSTVPAGFTINSSTGIISAASPTNSGTSNATYNVVFTATDGLSNSATANGTITIEAAVAVTSPAILPGVTTSANPNYQLTAAGGSGTGYTWAVTSGASQLAAIGLNVTSAGVLGGSSPVQGSANFTVTATDSQSHVSAGANLSVTVYSALTITTSSPLPSGYGGALYSVTFQSAGGTGTGLNWTITSGQSQLTALNLSLGATTGVLSGTSPQAGGSATFGVKVTDSNSNQVSGTFAVTIDAGLSIISGPTLQPGVQGDAYSVQLNSAGGSGTGLSWSVTSGQSQLAAVGLSLASGGLLTGANPAAGTASFGVKVTDSASNSATATLSVTINGALSITSGPTLISGTAGTAYSQQLGYSGGVATGINWTVTSNQSQLTALGLSLSSTGLLAGSNPTSGSASFGVRLTDSLNDSATATLSVTINTSGQTVSGQINWAPSCTGTNPTLPNSALSVKIANSANTFTQTATVDSSGNFSFSGVLADSYTVTPLYSGPAGSSSLFYPATYSVSVGSSSLTGENFQVSLGFTLSGTVHYTGSKTGPIYLVLASTNTTCGNGSGLPGTAISTKGSYSIHGVAPGDYTLNAVMDPVGEGSPNVVDPQGSVSASISTSNVSGTDVTLTDPTPTVPSNGPQLNLVSPASSGVVIVYNPLTTNNVEAVTSYTVQWSTSSSFGSIAGSISFPANGANGANVWIVNSGSTFLSGGLSNGTAYYFRAQGVLGSNTTGWTVYGSPTTVTPGQLTSVANCNTSTGGSSCQTITGSISIPSGVTINGPLYAGLFSSQYGVYVTRINAPGAGQANAFTVYAPTGKGYFFFGILDQTNSGLIGNFDLTNISSATSSRVDVVSGGVSNLSLTLPGGNIAPLVLTQYYSNTCYGCSSTNTGYTLDLGVVGAGKQPIAAQLNPSGSTAGPNILNGPIDLTICTSCGGTGGVAIVYETNISGTPVVNDTYTFAVTYSDGTTDTQTGKISGVLTNSQLATNLSPSGNVTGTQPTFTWTYPASASSYSYEFDLYSQSGQGSIWNIPGSGSSNSGFLSTDIPSGSLTWGIDPTNSNNTPSPSSLTHNSVYVFSITTKDSNGNSGQSQVWFQP